MRGHPTPFGAMTALSHGCATVLLLLLACPGLVFPGATGELVGQVTGPDGSVLPGVTASVSSPRLQGSRTAISNRDGTYRVLLLPPGTYSVEFSLDGMETVVYSAVTLAANQTTKVNAVMQVGVLSEELTVRADTVVIDPTQTTMQTNFNEHFLQSAIGSSGRSFLSVIKVAPGVVTDGSDPVVMGANIGQNSYLLDGMTITEPTFHMAGARIPYDAIQEVSIQTLGRDAEYGRAIGGVVSVITRSGGNRFSGSLDVRYEDENTYESGDNFDPDLQPMRQTRPSASLGGPLVVDRLWFFLAAERPDFKTTPPNVHGFQPPTRTSRGWDFLGKLTASPGSSHSLSLRTNRHRAETENWINSSGVRPEADLFHDETQETLSLGYDAVLSENWIASLQVGEFRSIIDESPMGGDESAIGGRDDVTGVSWGNPFQLWFFDMLRREVVASTSLLVDAFGSHMLKVGMNLDRSEAFTDMRTTGTGVDPSYCRPEFGQPDGAECSAFYTTWNGAPSALTLWTATQGETYQSDLNAFFVQDDWHPIPSVTARVGLRYDDVKFSLPRRSDAPRIHALQPRVGVAWDIRNDASSVVHAFYGRMMDDSTLAPLAWYGTTNRIVASAFSWNPVTERYDFDGAWGGVQDWDRPLRPTTSTEASIGFAQKIWRNSSVDVSAVRRESHDIIEDTCGTPDCSVLLMTNRPGGRSGWLRNESEGVVTRFELRPWDWMHAIVSHTWSKSRGSVEYAGNSGSDFNVYPWHFINMYGYLATDARHRFKVHGLFQVPADATVSVSYAWDSGTAWAPVAALDETPAAGGVLFLEPRGSRRLGSWHQLDLQLAKQLSIRGLAMGLIGSVFNVFGTETVLARGNSIGPYAACGDSDGNCLANPLYGVIPDQPEKLHVSADMFGQPVAWQQPRRYEVGIRLQF